jgi:hypothetical protein
MKRVRNLAILLATLLACKSGNKKTSAAASAVTASPGGPFERAQVQRTTTGTPRGGRGGIGSRSEKHTLLVVEGKAGRKEIVLDDGEYALSFAPHAHAIAVRRDDEDNWTYAGLDTEGDPLYCPHWRFGKKSEPWNDAPSTTALALDVLNHDVTKSATRHGNDALPTQAEVEAAASYACRKKDRALLDALVGLAREGASFPSYDPGLTCLPALVKQTPELGASLVAHALANRSGKQRKYQLAWVAKILEGAGDEPAQEALAKLFDSELARSQEHDEPRKAIGIALTEVTRRRREAPAGARAVLQQLFTDDRCKGNVPCGEVRERAWLAIEALPKEARGSIGAALARGLIAKLERSRCAEENAWGDHRDVLGWAVARLARVDGSTAGEDVERALTMAARSKEDCKHHCQSECATMRVHAVLGLSQLKTSGAMTALRELANGSCAEPIAQKLLEPELWERPMYMGAGDKPLACWAKLALA